MRRKECPGCGNTFVALRSTARFCSTRCRMRLHRYVHRKDVANSIAKCNAGKAAIAELRDRGASDRTRNGVRSRKGGAA